MKLMTTNKKGPYLELDPAAWREVTPVLDALQRAVLLDIHHQTTAHVDELIADGEFPRHEAFARCRAALRRVPRLYYEPADPEDEDGTPRITNAGQRALGIELAEQEER